MSRVAAAWFDTVLGRAALAWSPDGVTAVALPDADERATARWIARRAGGAEPGPLTAAPAEVRDAAARMAALLAGAPDDLGDVVLDLGAVEQFARDVYARTRLVGPGRTTTYGAIAYELGAPGAARAVGRALGANPVPIVVPCHRVLAADGTLGGFSAPGGTATKRRMLVVEGAAVAAAAPTLFDLP